MGKGRRCSTFLPQRAQRIRDGRDDLFRELNSWIFQEYSMHKFYRCARCGFFALVAVKTSGTGALFAEPKEIIGQDSTVKP
jgi:hypothetical protein